MEHVVEAPHAGVVTELCVQVGEQVASGAQLLIWARPIQAEVGSGMAGVRPRQVRIVEVGPRDGLQNEAARISTDVKIHFVDLLSAAGFPWIEVTSFVHPRAVPQMADADEVFARHTQAAWRALRGARAQPARTRAGAGGAGAGHRAVRRGDRELQSRQYQSQHRPVARGRARRVDGARRAGARVRAYISVAFGCPYEGPVVREQVAAVAEPLFDLGVDEVVLGDTIGVATPADVRG